MCGACTFHAAPNNSFEPTANQLASHRELVRSGVMCAAAQFRRSAASHLVTLKNMKTRLSLILLLLFTVSSVFAQESKPTIPEIDRLRLAEAFRIGETLGNKVWKDWDKAPFAVLLVTPENEFLIRHPQPSKDFMLVGYDSLLKSDVYFRKRTKQINLLATFPAVGGVSTIVIGQAENTSKKTSTPWVVTVLHEHFHQLQMSQPTYYQEVDQLNLSGGDQTGMWQLNFAFPYKDAQVGERFTALSKVLAETLQTKKKSEFSAKLDEYLKARQAFQQTLSPADYRYFSFQIWQEGIARYTEWRIADLAARKYKPSKEFLALKDYTPLREVADTILNKQIMTSLPTLQLEKWERNVFYPFGAAEGLLLDRANRKWKSRYLTEKFYIDKYFVKTNPDGVFQQPARFISADSQKFVLGPEALVSTNQDGGDLRCEPSAAIFKDTIVVAWNDSYGGRHGSSTGTAVGWSISRDRGKTFQFGGYLPLAQNDFVPAAADSRLAIDQEGNFFLQILSWQEKSRHIQLYLMEKNNPGKWRKLPDAIVYDKSKGEEYLDKPAMGGSGNRVGIVYTEKRLTSGATISFVLSNDKGKTWFKPVQLSAASKRVRSGSAVIINGNKIMAAWTESDSLNASEIWFTRSQDGGKSFSVAAQAYKLKRPFTPPKAYRMAYGQMAHISNDISLSGVMNPSGGTVYSLSFVEGIENGSDVLLMSYDAKSQKWSEPIRLGESDTGPVKIFSSMAVVRRSPAHLFYRRNGANSTITDVYVSILSEARRFESFKLNTVSSDWATTKGDEKYAPIQRIFGDYITLASNDNVLVATWTDGRHGSSRIYARVIEAR